MKIELIYGEDGTINGYRKGYYSNANQKPIPENEYDLDEKEEEKLIEFLEKNHKAKDLKKSKLKYKKLHSNN